MRTRKLAHYCQPQIENYKKLWPAYVTVLSLLLFTKTPAILHQRSHSTQKCFQRYPLQPDVQILEKQILNLCDTAASICVKS